MTSSLALPNTWLQQPQMSLPPAQPQVIGPQVTVFLLQSVACDLRRLQRRTNWSATDLVNRSITAYEFIDTQFRDGHSLLIRDGRTSETRLVQFL